MADRPPPGLRSIYAGREDRARGRYTRPTTSLLLFAIVGVVLTLVGYNVFSGRKLEQRRDAVLQKQRAVQMTVGAEWTPLRDHLEQLTMDDAKDFQGDFVDHGALAWDFKTAPGLYLRLRVRDAHDAVSLRRAALQSSRDAFVGCLLHEPAGSPESDAGAGPFGEQPWNLRRAYTSTRILTDDWVSEVKGSDDDLRLRVFEQQFEKSIHEEIPLAVAILKRAEFFLLVLDEEGAVKAAPGAPETDGGPPSAPSTNGPDEMTLQLEPHPTRVHLFNLKTNTEMFRLRRSAEASFVLGNEGAQVSADTRAAMQRQVNNCALANEVTEAVTPVPPPASTTTKP